MKQCTKCQETKSLDDFYREKRVSDGYQAQCKSCMREHKRLARQKNPNLDREYYQANRERLQLKRKIKYSLDEEGRAKEREQQRLYYQKHREALKAKVRAYNKTNAAKISERNRLRRQDPDYVKVANERSRKYRANPANHKVLAHRTMQYYSRKYEAKGFSTKAQLQARWDYYGGRCWICTDEAKEMDHVIPLSKGGTNWPANLKPICRSCNARKSNTWPYKPLDKE